MSVSQTCTVHSATLPGITFHVQDKLRCRKPVGCRRIHWIGYIRPSMLGKALRRLQEKGGQRVDSAGLEPLQPHLATTGVNPDVRHARPCTHATSLQYCLLVLKPLGGKTESTCTFTAVQSSSLPSDDALNQRLRFSQHNYCNS